MEGRHCHCAVVVGVNVGSVHLSEDGWMAVVVVIVGVGRAEVVVVVGAG